MRLENVPTLSSIEVKFITLFSIALTSCNDIEKIKQCESIRRVQNSRFDGVCSMARRVGGCDTSLFSMLDD